MNDQLLNTSGTNSFLLQTLSTRWFPIGNRHRDRLWFGVLDTHCF